jgi:hypothetical protein
MLLGVVASLDPVQAAFGFETPRVEQSSNESPAVAPAITPEPSASATSEEPVAQEPEVEVIPRTALKPAASKSASSDLAQGNMDRAPDAEEAKKPSRESVEPSTQAAFDASAARESIVAAASRAQSCRAPDGPKGTSSVLITFAPSGRVTQTVVADPPLAGTTVGGCVAAAMRSASVPAYNGERVTVSKRVTIE